MKLLFVLFFAGYASNVMAEAFSTSAVAATGNICVADKVTARISANGATLTLDVGEAELSLAAPKKLARGTCQAIVTLKHPDGMAATPGEIKFASVGSGQVTAEARLQTSGQCGASTNLIIKAAILMKSAGKTTLGPALDVPLTWTKCAKTTHK